MLVKVVHKRRLVLRASAVSFIRPIVHRGGSTLTATCDSNQKKVSAVGRHTCVSSTKDLMVRPKSQLYERPRDLDVRCTGLDVRELRL